MPQTNSSVHQKVGLLALLLLLATSASAQEICDNGIDDDSDGFIDLNDPDCDCGSSALIPSLFPNPSFENNICCPGNWGQLVCCDAWVQASAATSDYFYDGCFVLPAATANNLSPPPDGNGFVGGAIYGGFYPGYHENIGACLTSPMLAGIDYDLSFNLASTPVTGVDGIACNNSIITYSTLDITIYGSSVCNLPLPGTGCPSLADPLWQPIGTVSYNPQTSWSLVSTTLSPLVDIHAVIVGAPCILPNDYLSFPCTPYFYFDNFGLFPSLNHLQLNSTGNICAGDLIYTATADTTGGTYQWYFDGVALAGEDSSSIDIGSGPYGLYTVQYILNTICIIADVNISFENNIDIISNNPTCSQYTDGSITLQDTLNGNIAIYEITDSIGNILNNGGSNSANLLGEGWYYFSVTSGGCSISDSLFIDDPEPLIANIDVTDVLCHGDTTGAVIVSSISNYSGAYDQLTFSWTPDVGIQGTGADSIYNIAAGNYTLTLNDSNNCSYTVNFIVNEPSQLVLDYGSIPAMCRTLTTQTANGVVWASASGGTGSHTYLWTNLQDSSTSTNSTWGALDPGAYNITVTDGNGCKASTTISVDEVVPLADFSMTSPQFTADYEGTTPVTVNFQNESLYYIDSLDSIPNGNVFWTFDHPNMAWVSYDVSPFDTTYALGGVYTVCIKVINKFNCVDSVCKDIIVHHKPLDFTPVNVFTPGSDGANDIFTFDFLAEGVETFTCAIVNRWGRTIYEINDISQGWNGTDKSGSECPHGVYFYEYEGTTGNGDSFQGHGTVTLIRE